MSERTEALLQKAVAAHLAGKVGEASELYAQVLRKAPRDFRALHLGGAAAFQMARMPEAERLLRLALGVKPDSGSTSMCLGLVCSALGKDEEAEQFLKAGIALEARNPEAWQNLGSFLLTQGRNAEAMSCFERVRTLKPDSSDAFTGIGSVLKAEGQAVRAVPLFEKALQLLPSNTTARIGLMQALQGSNRITESMAQCERLLEADPGNILVRSSQLFLLNYLPEVDARQLLRAHQDFGRLFPRAARGSPPGPGHGSKRLRIAFLSPDLRWHSVAFFLEPLLEHLDSSLFEVVLYHDHPRVDSMSQRLRSHASLWRNFASRPDGFVEETIRADAPDVLVDLAGHSGQNRVHLFARRLAPVQVTYLGYPNTTGVAEMDYRFTDAIADPEGDADLLSSEGLVRFSPCAWSYNPPPEARAMDPIAPSGAGTVTTFGSFNNAGKLNERTLRLWARVLEAVPGSRLVLKSFGMDQDRLRPRARSAGIDVARLDLLSAEPTVEAHLASYGRIDIALDPTPYCGTTTTCEALWMGRPVISLSGDRHASRVGASLLRAIDRPEWVAAREEDLVRIAAGLASDRTLLRAESASLRRRLESSVLMDHAGQARRFEAALRHCWTNWCGGSAEPRAALASETVLQQA